MTDVSVVFKTLVDVVDGLHGQSLLLDTIFWRGAPWLVGGRLPTENGKTQRPTRIVRPLLFPFLPPQTRQLGEDYILSVAVPKAILDGQQAFRKRRSV